MCKWDSVKLAEQVLKIFTIIDDCSVKNQVQKMKAKIRTTINWVLRNVSWTRRTMSSCPFILAYFPAEHVSKRFCFYRWHLLQALLGSASFVLGGSAFHLEYVRAHLEDVHHLPRYQGNIRDPTFGHGNIPEDGSPLVPIPWNGWAVRSLR